MAGDAIVGRIVALLEVKGDKFTAGITKAHGEFSGLGNAAMKFAGVLGVAFSAKAVVDFVSECVTAFAEEQAVLVSLGTAVNATGANWGDYITATQEAMVAGEEFGFKGHETAKALEILTVMTGDAAKGYKLLALAQDMTRGRPGTDLAANAALLAKVAEGRIAMASRVLPFLKGVTDVGQAMGLMEQHFGGQAEAFALTTQCAIDRMSASWEGFKETLGSKVAPEVSKSLDDMSAAMNRVSSGDVAGGVWTAVLGEQMNTYIDAADAVGDYSNELGALYDGTMTMTPQIAAKMKELRASAAGASTYVADATSTVSRFGDAANLTATATQDAADATTTGEKAWGDYLTAVGKVAAATDKLKQARATSLPGSIAVLQAEQDLRDAMGGVDTASQDLSPKQETLADKFNLLSHAVRGTTAAFVAQTQAMSQGRGAREQALDNIIAVDDAEKALGEARKTHDPAVIDRAEMHLADVRNFAAQTADGLTKAEARAAVKRGDLTRSSVIAAIKNGELTGSIGDYIKKLLHIPKSVHTEVTANTEPAETEIDRLLAKWASVSKTLNLHVYGPGAPTPPKPKPTPKPAPAKSKPTQGGGASGGIVRASGGGTPITVAENGFDERLFNMAPANRSRNLAMLGDTAAALGASGGSGRGDTHYHVTVYADSMSDRRAIRAEVEGALSTITRGSRSLAFGG